MAAINIYDANKFMKASIWAKREFVEGSEPNNRVLCPFVVHREPDRKDKSVAKSLEHPYQLNPKYLSKKFTFYRNKSSACSHLPQEQRPTFHEIRALASHLLKQQGYDAQSRMAHKDKRSTDTYTKDHVKWVVVPHAEIAVP